MKEEGEEGVKESGGGTNKRKTEKPRKKNM